MKQQILHFILIIAFAIAFPFNARGSTKVIDFNFPQEVSNNALADLDKALKNGDGQLVVDALVRYSVAQSSISQDNMADIISRIETVFNKEKQLHIKALLYHLEALVYQGYRDRYTRWSDRNNPVEETPADISEWDRKQFDKKIVELIEKSLAEPQALKAVAVTSLPVLIWNDELAVTFVPKLHEFLLMRSLEMLRQIKTDNKELEERIKADWLATTEGNVPAHIYALTQSQSSIPFETYQQYQDNEHCAYLLDYLTWESEDKIQVVKGLCGTLPQFHLRAQGEKHSDPVGEKVSTPLLSRSVLFARQHHCQGQREECQCLRHRGLSSPRFEILQ